MPEPTSGSIPLLQADPDLGRGLDPRRGREATSRLVARTVQQPRGRFCPDRLLSSTPRPLGLLVLDGLVVRETSVGPHPCAELLAQGDLLRAPDAAETEVLLPRTISWTALTPTRLALVDHALALRCAQWPEVLTALVERASRRAERLAVLQAVCHLTRVEDRLLAALWALAERWGRVVPGGVLVPLRLPHRTLAGLVGARRPSVTTALGQLIARGELARRDGGAWLLLGDPPEEGHATGQPVALPA